MIKGDMVIDRKTNKSTLYVIFRTNNSIIVASIGIDAHTCHCKLRHISEKVLEVMHS